MQAAQADKKADRGREEIKNDEVDKEDGSHGSSGYGDDAEFRRSRHGPASWPGRSSRSPGQIAPPDPPPVPYCVKHPVICGDHVPPGQIATADPTPDDPNPGDPTPGDPNPPADPNPPGDTNEGGGSNAGSSDDSGGYGNTGTVGGTFDRGGVFISGLLPNSFTSMLGDVGNSVKDNLPAAIAKNVPNTDGGWSLLALVVASLATGGLVLRSAAKRISRATRTAQ